MRNRCIWALLALAIPTLSPAEDPAAKTEFFERRIRPLLAEHCFSCHSAQAPKLKAGLRLDGRENMRKGGDSGPAIEPGRPEKSRLIEAVGYANVELQMPPRGRLSDEAIADITKWVRDGAQWPDAPKNGESAIHAFDLAARKAAHWCWQPIRVVAPPSVKARSWPLDSVDEFVLAKLEAARIAPSPPADPRTLLRRASYAITGLPPVGVEEFAANPSQANFAAAIDRMLASPRFGERWARHWLDLVRYAETRGHEFDYAIPNAWQYRDYVIRALNADVPYDQFVREHVAGDLIHQPRRHPIEGFNESVIATGFWHLGENIHSPVDIRQDEADRFDNMIDVFGKTFLGLTVACARCHDHKFDAISAKDYYALYAVLASSGYRQARFDSEVIERRVAQSMDTIQERDAPRIRQAIAKILLDEVAPEKPSPVLARNVSIMVDFAELRGADWRPDGAAFGSRARRRGELLLSADSANPLLGVVVEPGAYADPFWVHPAITAGLANESGDLGRVPRAGRTIRTPAFTLDGRKLHYRVRGSGLCYAAVHTHTMLEGPLHRKLVNTIAAGTQFKWIEHDLTRYPGHRCHLEFTATSPDFAVSQVMLGDTPPVDELSKVAAPLDDVLKRWAACGELSPADAATIDAFIRGASAQAQEKLAAVVRPIVIAKAKLADGARRTSRLAPAMYDGSSVDGRVYVRGNPKAAGESVPRRLPEAIFGDAPLPGPGSGRLALSEQLTDPQRNPLIARVIVNRVWHHLFGQGIVASVENFGVLGERPSHPELLDFLADRFVREGWSIKKLIRELVLTRAYQQSSHERPDAAADSGNKLIHRMNVHRLEGEAIRDTLLALAGRFDETMYGPPVPAHITPFMDGRGKPAKSGPGDGAGRRSIYLEVRRNFPPPALVAFDTPTPFTTIGRRSVSNVPAQALILLNDEFVREQTARWAKKWERTPENERIGGMFRDAFSRPPTPEEASACREFAAARNWAELAHALVNVKEFIYVE